MKLHKLIPLVCLMSVFAVVASSCDDDDGEEEGSCFIQCPSDEWAQENIDPGQPSSQQEICEWMDAFGQEDCEALAEENGDHCAAVWVEDCLCEDECNPFE